ncbi:cytochrome C oxidase subunit IV family protein [Pedobacter boryungensis]|uniref:Cytochrome C oxidase subunit IV family protein n=1 Tax=Pedobacter boryungensis TaxID=869962 RepID=A0ABX2DCY4_9SPHI|nr:cytochrome C oxidase subunit IV family protein [Pedobacter boryungensis]NQX31951.1 cytochrome C oxidase subunit IV family protein [Pedobacter boryungensis]
MSEQHIHTTDEHAHGEHEGMTKKKIWKVFGILLMITVIEFIIALWAIPQGHLTQHTGNYIYIVLTLLKAFYIVAYFMHLKFEKLGLQLALSVSFVFIIYFITLMLIEGGYLHIHMPKV